MTRAFSLVLLAVPQARGDDGDPNTDGTGGPPRRPLVPESIARDCQREGHRSCFPAAWYGGR